MSITVDSKISVEIEIYNNIYAIKEGWVDQKGVFKVNWCKKDFGREKVEKIVPVRVRLGEKETALAVLRELIAEIEGTEPAPF